jgi:AcrR family transcriptional regulator
MRNVPARPARERVLETAGELFYREGIRAVGIDTIIAQSGVAKMSLYRHFASKEELVVAYLQERDRIYWQRWDRVMAAHPGEPRRQIADYFADLARRVARPDYRGCPFTNAATEFPDPGHPGRAVAAANKRELKSRLGALAAALGVAQPERLAGQLVLLIEGAYSSALSLGPDASGADLEAAAEALVAAALSVTLAQNPQPAPTSPS